MHIHPSPSKYTHISLLLHERCEISPALFSYKSYTQYVYNNPNGTRNQIVSSKSVKCYFFTWTLTCKFTHVHLRCNRIRWARRSSAISVIWFRQYNLWFSLHSRRTQKMFDEKLKITEIRKITNGTAALDTLLLIQIEF